MKIDKKITSSRSNWKFDKKVVQNFDKHINSSVPFYKISHDLTVKMSDFFIKDKSICYDLGCSNGNLLKDIQQRHSKKKINLIGIDESKEMIKSAKKNTNKIKFLSKNLVDFNYQKSDFITSLYTLQFVQPKFRQKLINKLYSSLNWGGGLILFEKIRGNDARFQDILNFSYFDFKTEQKLSPIEILNKEISLRSVLEPYTIGTNLDFLKRAGFKDIMPISQYLCFVGFLAIK
jgi:tRNA (cmo5U34)-methyltransferase